MRRTLAELVAQLPRAKRTPNNRVLLALATLSATDDGASVRSGEIAKELQSSLGNAAVPTNLPAALQKLKPKVHSVSTEGRLTWCLTETGRGYLHDLLGTDPIARKGDTFGCDVGVVCALEHPEYTALRGAMGGEAHWTSIDDSNLAHRYSCTNLKTEKGTLLKVVGTTSMSMGLTSAAIAATQMILIHKPKLVVMVGIAAGTRAGGKEFGDVLVADPSVDYSSGKIVETAGVREFQPDPYPLGLNARLRSVLRSYASSPRVFAEIRSRWVGVTPAKQNRLHLGPLGAADQVVDDAAHLSEVQKHWRKLIGVEMETYAVYRACHDAPEPKPRYVSFKAVCDFAADKSDSWQEYAAFVAAEFATRFLVVEWEALWPRQSREGERQ